MDHTVYIWMRLEDFVKVLLFPDIDIIEIGPLARDKLYAIDGLFGRVQEVVHNHHLVVCL